MKDLFFALLLFTAFFLTASCKNEIVVDPPPTDSSLFTLSDGRALSYTTTGIETGAPVFYFHGFPGSHIDVHLFNGPTLAEQTNLRLIAVDRPGYGSSDPDPGRNLNDWPEDLIELADHLGINTFSILGYSGGAPFALACAAAIPERIQKVVIVSGMGPLTAPGAKKGKAMLIPKAPKLILKGMNRMIEKNPDKLESNLKNGFPEVDRAILEDPEILLAMTTTIREGFRSGYAGGLEDARIYKSPWEIDLTHISVPVMVWHGDFDKNVRIETAEYVIQHLPQCTSMIKSGEGHLSLISKYNREILASLK